MQATQNLLSDSIGITVLAALALIVTFTLINDRCKGWVFVTIMLVWIFCQGPGALVYLLFHVLG